MGPARWFTIVAAAWAPAHLAGGADSDGGGGSQPAKAGSAPSAASRPARPLGMLAPYVRVIRSASLPATAVIAYKRGLRIDATHPALHEAFIRRMHTAGQTALADAAARALATIDKDHPVVWASRADGYVRQGRRDEALTAVARTTPYLARYPFCADVAGEVIALYDDEEDLADAIRASADRVRTALRAGVPTADSPRAGVADIRTSPAAVRAALAGSAGAARASWAASAGNLAASPAAVRASWATSPGILTSSLGGSLAAMRAQPDSVAGYVLSARTNRDLLRAEGVPVYSLAWMGSGTYWAGRRVSLPVASAGVGILGTRRSATTYCRPPGLWMAGRFGSGRDGFSIGFSNTWRCGPGRGASVSVATPPCRGGRGFAVFGP